MYVPRQLVVPVDFSEPSRAAAWRARQIAVAFGAPLHLVHAVRYPVVGSYAELGGLAGTWDAVRNQAREMLCKLESALALDGPVVSSEVAQTDPLSAIASAVEKHAANLIVMGTHGYSGLQHAFLGSVAERTLRTVNCPTLTVRGSEAPALEPIRRILYATDFSSHSKRAALLARGLAVRFGASVEVIHVFVLPSSLEVPYGIPPATDAVARLRNQAGEMLEVAAQVFEGSQLEVHRKLHTGLPSEVIPREARRLGADLIVMGTRGNTGLEHVFMGSVTERTLRAAHCSVLTTKDGDPM